MPIPPIIIAEHIKQAMARIDREGVPQRSSDLGEIH